MRLGEALVKDALITREQLEQALKRQIQFGGRIGTNIVELRFLEEQELAKFLGKFFKAPAVSLNMINSIPEDVTNAITVDVVNKYKILPFKKDRNKLYIAMLDPKDIREIDELRFVTGFEIIPHVVTELMLVYALEKYYGIKRDVRYISLSDRFNPDTKVEESSIEKIKFSFTAVKETEEIAAILINESYKIAKRVALFSIKGGNIVGWKSRGIDIESFTAQGKEPAVLFDVVRTKSNYRGPILKIKGNEPLINILSGTPQDALILPIILRERVVGLLYVDNGTAAVLNANVGFLSMLVSMAAIAFEIMILKKRILDLTFPL